MHEKRMNLSRKKLTGNDDTLRLSDYIQAPQGAQTGLYKCRVIYGSSVESVEYTLYTPADIKTLKLVEAGSLTYDNKYFDRSQLTGLIDKTIADDILIVRDGCITDASFANIVFTDGKRWITPDTPLLHGTMREKLLIEGIISMGRITVDDLARFTHFRLINAMLGSGSPVLEVSKILI